MAILIAAQTDAAVSATFNMAGSNALGAAQTFQIIGGALGALEYVTLQYADGANWRDAKVGGNAGKILDVDNAVCPVYAKLSRVRLSKSATSAALGVEVV